MPSSNTYRFELVRDGAVVGDGWVVAPSPEGARYMAECFLAGLNEVRILPGPVRNA